MTDAIPAPFALYTDTVRADWIDYNRHLMDGYYLVYFSFANEAVFDRLGLDAVYRQRTRCTTYTVESHLNFWRELKSGAPIRFTSQLLACDAKRVHLFTAMYHAQEGYLAATSESMYLHVNQVTMKVESMPSELSAWIEKVRQAHSALPRPPQAGRSVGIPKKTS